MSDPAPRGFRPNRRRRNRIGLGVLLAAVAIGGNVWLYTSLDDTEAVVQVTRDVPAGEQLTLDMLRTVDVEVDASVNVIPAEQLETLVGSFAKVRLVSGSLVTMPALQSSPLVAADSAIVAIQVADGSLPIGLRERVPVLLVIPGEAEPTVIDGRVVGLPTATTSALGTQSLSVEVDRTESARIAAADDVRVVLVEPLDDPAITESVQAVDPVEPES